jgi:hypothetical protein
MLTPVLNADFYSSDELSTYHSGMSDAMRCLDAPWQSTINKAEEAAWSALELSEDRYCKLIDVRLTDEW